MTAGAPAPWLLISGDFTPLGGMDRANHALASHLAGEGVRVHLVTHRAWPDLGAHPGVTVHRVPRPMGSHLLGQSLLDRSGRRWARQLAPRDARVVVNGGNCRWGDVNWVHYVHAAWRPRGGPGGGALRRIKAAAADRRFRRDERDAIRRARLVVANSERTRRDVIESLDVPPERVHTVYYGADPERFRPPTPEERREARALLGWGESDDRPAVAFVGALGDARKGFDTLYGAWRRLARDPGWDARLVVVGAGATLPAWRARAEAEGLGGSIRFLGFRDDVPRVLAACDLLVSPTRYEAYGLNVQEALCCGLPAIVSASAGVAERYPGPLGALLLPDPDDDADLASRIAAWRSGARAGPRGRRRPRRRTAGPRAGAAAPPRSSPWPGARLDRGRRARNRPCGEGGGAVRLGRSGRPRGAPRRAESTRIESVMSSPPFAPGAMPRPAGARRPAAPRPLPWTWLERFLIIQAFIPALLFVPGISSARTVIRMASFLLALAVWFAIVQSGRARPGGSFPAGFWLKLAAGWLALSVFHWETRSIIAGGAQATRDIAVLSPAFWALALSSPHGSAA